ncbi:glycosyltransferase [Leucobacter sp. NPDC058333]|uniref:bifunctional glycosyltransferase/CDP-glycerol:glycerophosphate glycerophosphotransferase n=1 Tax=Leucobacter sp. NPDC058333 TaxID=3346450 RepID=UPI003648CF55
MIVDIAMDRSQVNLQQDKWDALLPQTSLIIACYKVGPYLPAFLQSLDAQTAVHGAYELIFVIDGCPEDSEAVVRQWMGTTDYAVRIVVKENGGVASARNAGLACARGVWVTHPDPDDRLEPDYLTEFERSQQRFPDETMFAARAVLTAADGTVVGHTLDARYEDGETRIIDLIEDPRKIHTLGGVAFFRRDLIELHALRFNEQILQSSDTDFIGHYLLCTDARYVLVPDARYLYLRRNDASSIVSTHSGNMSRYASLFGVSHRGLLDRAGTECPSWLANLLLYFVFMLFRRNRSTQSPVDLASGQQLAEIRARLVENLQSIGAANVRAFDLFAVPLEFRYAWLSAIEPVNESPVEHLRWYRSRGMRRVAVYASQPSVPELRVAAGPVEIIESKLCGIDFLGTRWLTKRVVKLRGRFTDAVRLESPTPKFTVEFGGEVLTADEIRDHSGLQAPIALQAARGKSAVAIQPRPARERIATQARRLLRDTRDVWIFTTGDDSARAVSDSELLYKAARKLRPDVNARFVAKSGSHAAHRMRRAAGKTVTAGSGEHHDLLQLATQVITSRITRAVLDPIPGTELPRSWRVALISDRPYDRLSFRDPALRQAEFVAVSSAIELERVSGSHSFHDFLVSEAALTGLPHHDLLLRKAGRPTNIVVAPEWRAGVALPEESLGHAMSEFRELPFLREWCAYLSSSALHDFARDSGRRIILILPDGVPSEVFAAPAGIDLVTHERRYDAIGTAALLVTDYSQLAHDAAYLHRPSIYLRVDRETVLGAPDSARSKSQAAEAEGFGPVVTSSADAVEATRTLLEGIPSPYQRRMDAAFTYRDGAASSRIVARL